MRFTFVDRIVAAEPPRRIETSTHVSGLDDVFADHFPGYPVLPGALVVEAFIQTAQLLIGLSHEFTRVGRLRGLSRVDGRRVAAAALEFALETAGPDTDAGRHAERLRAQVRQLPRAPVAVASGDDDE
jgi:3-hydroxymyristoyl/3-hydroxydecanoyl-(acyl carrier protein) dehydratase